MPRAYVGLGANLGDRQEFIDRAITLLAATDGVHVLAVSELIETDPVGLVDQPRYLNGAAAVETTLSARASSSRRCSGSRGHSDGCVMSGGARGRSISTCWCTATLSSTSQV